MGCWLWRRKSVTANFLSGGLKDRQQAKDHSWWVVKEGAWAIRKDDHPALYEKLLSPPGRFILALLQDDQENRLQQMVANDGEPDISFTLDGRMLSYTVADLTGALRGETTSPGAMALVKRLGPYKLPEPEKRPSVGRPKKR